MRTSLPGGSLSPIKARFSCFVSLRQSSIMAIEIERKFLVRDESWRQGVRGSWFIQQGYF